MGRAVSRRKKTPTVVVVLAQNSACDAKVFVDNLI